ncbi:MAG: hypothetical protein HQ581_15100, partial [Planctomycetes bacterium]|nr:hypothetical protein [Planctomycetota bacterium]
PGKPDLSAAVEAARKKAVEEAIEAAIEGDDPEKQIRLEIFRTGTMSAQDLFDLLQEPEPIDEDPDKQRIAQRQIGRTTIKQRKNRSPFLRVAFSGQTIQLFDPQMAFDSDGNGYLFWKVHEREEYVPEDPDFKGENEEEKTEEQVKEQRLLWRKVAAKWQMVNDRQRALDEAKALAAGVENADKPLAELLGGDRKVLETAGFSWLTEGRITGQSPVRPIVFSRVMLREEDEEGKPLLDKEGKQLEVDLEAGEEFLRVASGLEVGGKLGVAMDNPQKHAYIIRLTDAPSDEQLWETCLNDNGKSQNNERIPPDYERVGQTVGWQRYGEWRAKIQESAELEWKRPPDPSGGFR